MNKLWIALVAPAMSLLAQTDAAFYSAGYAGPAPVEVAPGQIVTLFFRGIKPSANGFPRAGQAQTVPLPETLAGISANIFQTPQTNPFRVPIISVRQTNECEEVMSRAICLLTAIRVQIPFELTPAVAKLVVEEDGQASRTFLLRPIRDNSHLLTTCDLTWDTNPGSTCNRIAFHADGTAVDERSPAKLGETVVVYAYGLGPTTPRAATGAATPAAAPVIDAVARQLKAGFVVLRNAPSLPRYVESEPPVTEGAIGYAGLVADQIGLYQINLRIPASIEVPIRCGGDTQSNLLAKISTSQGVENLPLCVAP